MSLSLVLLLFFRLADTQSPPPNYSYNQLPDTSFSCRGKAVGGYYADVEAHCQMFHVCGSSQLTSFRFLCPNNTVFDQQHLICSNWHQVRCDDAAVHYARNFEIFKTAVGDPDDFRTSSGNTLQNIDYDDYDTRLSGSIIDSRSIGTQNRGTNSGSSRNRVSDTISSNSITGEFDARDQFDRRPSRTSPFAPSQSVSTNFNPSRQNTAFNRDQSLELPNLQRGEFASSPSTARPNFASQQDSPRAAVFNQLVIEPVEKTRPNIQSSLPVQSQRSVEQFRLESINERPVKSKQATSFLPEGSPSEQRRTKTQFGQELNPSTGSFFSSTVVPTSDPDDKIKFQRQDFIRRRKLQLNKNSELNTNQVLPKPQTFPSINRGFSATVPTRSTTPSTVFAEPSPPFNVGKAQNQRPNSIDGNQIAISVSLPNINSNNKPNNPKQSKEKPLKSRSRNRGSRKFNPNLPGGHLKSFEFRKINRVTPLKTKKPVFKTANKKRKISVEEKFINRNEIHNDNKRTNNVVFIPATTAAPLIFQPNNFPQSPRQTFRPAVTPTLSTPTVNNDAKRFDQNPNDRKKSTEKSKIRQKFNEPSGELLVTPWKSPARNSTKNQISSSDATSANLINEIFPNSNNFQTQTRKNPSRTSDKPLLNENKENSTSRLVSPFTTTTTSAPLVIRKRIKIFSKPRRRPNQAQSIKKSNIKPPVVTRKRINLSNKKTRKLIERPRVQLADEKRNQQQQQSQQQIVRTRVISTPRRRATLRPAFLRRATRPRQRITTIPSSSEATASASTRPPPSRKPAAITRLPRRRQSPASIYRTSVSPFTRAASTTESNDVARGRGTHSPTSAPQPESTATTPAPIVHVSTLPTNKEAPGLGRQSGFFVRPKLQLSSAVNSLAQRRDKITSLVGLARPNAFDHDNDLERSHRSTTHAPVALSSLSERWTPLSSPWQSGAGASDNSQLSSLLFDSSSPGQGREEGQQPDADYDYEYYDTAAASLEHLAKLARVNSQFKTLSKYKFI